MSTSSEEVTTTKSSTLAPATPSATGSVPSEPTPSATLEGSTELLLNGGFEDPGSSDNSAHKWEHNRLDNNKRVVNKVNRPGKFDKVVAYTGTAAYKFKGSPQTDTRITQVIKDPQATTGKLVLQAWVKAKKVEAELTLVNVKIIYIDGTKEVLALSMPNTSTSEYTQLSNSINMAGVPKKLKVQIGISGNGKFVIDDVSLMITDGLLSLP
jgi:hypothetical protein